MDDPERGSRADEHLLVKLYMELTGSSELCARSVVNYLEVTTIRVEAPPEAEKPGSENSE